MNYELLAGVYRHYKGTMVLVLGVARHSETEQKFVVYVPLGAKKGPRMTIRPLEMFQGNVTINDQEMPRFTYIAPEMPADLAEGYRETTEWGWPKEKK